jgi:hypothetical protein
VAWFDIPAHRLTQAVALPWVMIVAIEADQNPVVYVAEGSIDTVDSVAIVVHPMVGTTKRFPPILYKL